MHTTFHCNYFSLSIIRIPSVYKSKLILTRHIIHNYLSDAHAHTYTSNVTMKKKKVDTKKSYDRQYYKTKQ